MQDVLFPTPLDCANRIGISCQVVARKAYTTGQSFDMRLPWKFGDWDILMKERECPLFPTLTIYENMILQALVVGRCDQTTIRGMRVQVLELTTVRRLKQILATHRAELPDTVIQNLELILKLVPWPKEYNRWDA